MFCFFFDNFRNKLTRYRKSDNEYYYIKHIKSYLNILKLFKTIDIDLWEQCGKNPVKFLKLVDQEKLEKIAEDPEFLKEYNKNVENFEDYMDSKNTWFRKNFPENKSNEIYRWSI